MKMFVKYKRVWNEMILQLCKAKVAFLGNQNSRNPKNVFEGCEILETTQEFTLSQGDTILLNSLVRPLVSNSIYAKKDRNGLPSANQAASKDEPRCGHAVCTHRVHPPTSLSLALSAHAEPKSQGHCRK